MTTHVVHFKIEGEFITQLARTLWADDLEPEKAIRLLVLGLNRCTEPIAMTVLTGEKKLMGCNDLELVDDGETKSKCGNLLSAESVFGRIRRDKEDAEKKSKITIDLLNGDVVSFGSPWGQCRVPASMTEKTGDSYRPYRLKDNVETEDIKPFAVGMRNHPGLEEDERVEENPSILDDFIAGDQLLTKMEAEGAPTDNSLRSENGWVAPNGNFYPCGPIMHDTLANILHEDGVKAIEKTFVRISRNKLSVGCRSSIQFVGRETTQQQKDVVWDWCQKHGEECPAWAFGKE